MRAIHSLGITAVRTTSAISALALLVAIAGCATAPPKPPPKALAFPSPLAGPNPPNVERATERRISDGWAALFAGDIARATTLATQAGDTPAARLLALQAATLGPDPGTVAELEQLLDANPDYAAGWLTLSVAAEREGERQIAFDAARTGAELWPAERWQARFRALQSQWVEQPITEAARLLDDGQVDPALEVLRSARGIDPANRRGALLEARILIARGEPDRAEAVLTRLPRDDEVVLLAGQIAEARGDSSAALRIYSSLPGNAAAARAGIAIAEREGDWHKAMELYETLPEDDSDRDRGLREAKLRWRLSVMPDYVQKALRSPTLDRDQLAVVLVALAPKIETLAIGEVPLLSDIMQLPSQREILTAVRVGLVEADELEQVYHPYREVSGAEARAAIHRLALLLDLDAPRWCHRNPPPCTELGDPISGTRVSSIVIEMVTRGDE